MGGTFSGEIGAGDSRDNLNYEGHVVADMYSELTQDTIPLWGDVAVKGKEINFDFDFSVIRFEFEDYPTRNTTFEMDSIIADHNVKVVLKYNEDLQAFLGVGRKVNTQKAMFRFYFTDNRSELSNLFHHRIPTPTGQFTPPSNDFEPEVTELEGFIIVHMEYPLGKNGMPMRGNVSIKDKNFEVNLPFGKMSATLPVFPMNAKRDGFEFVLEGERGKLNMSVVFMEALDAFTGLGLKESRAARSCTLVFYTPGSLLSNLKM